ncbi:cysteine rich repeat-containing protein [Myxococcota bacterium]|nr:cysteine rich repeat-containing protein [Myxococcota bacterium]
MKSVFVPSLLLGAICLAGPAFAGDKAEKAEAKAEKAEAKAEKAEAKGNKGKGGVCKEDREKLCTGKGDKQSVRECLIANKDKLSPACKERMERSHGMVNDCRDDTKKHCADVKPGKGRVLECLSSHQADLSAACKPHVERAAARVKAAKEKAGAGKP